MAHGVLQGPVQEPMHNYLRTRCCTHAHTHSHTTAHMSAQTLLFMGAHAQYQAATQLHANMQVLAHTLLQT